VDRSEALMQQLHDEHAAALWSFCLRLTGHDRGACGGCRAEILTTVVAPCRGARPVGGIAAGPGSSGSRAIVIDELAYPALGARGRRATHLGVLKRSVALWVKEAMGR
jgi:hypothetical protein